MKDKKQKFRRMLCFILALTLALGGAFIQPPESHATEPAWQLATDSDFAIQLGGWYKYVGTKEYVILPDTINGIKYTNTNYMFKNNLTIKGVKNIPEGVISAIGMFSGDINFNIGPTHPYSLRTADEMYYNCTSLQEVQPFEAGMTSMKSTFGKVVVPDSTVIEIRSSKMVDCTSIFGTTTCQMTLKYPTTADSFWSSKLTGVTNVTKMPVDMPEYQIVDIAISYPDNDGTLIPNEKLSRFFALDGILANGSKIKLMNNWDFATSKPIKNEFTYTDPDTSTVGDKIITFTAYGITKDLTIRVIPESDITFHTLTASDYNSSGVYVSPYKYIEFPSEVTKTDCYRLFSPGNGASAVVAVKNFPKGLVNASYMFEGQFTLVSIPKEFPSTVTNLQNFAKDCTSLVNAPMCIPDSVTNASYIYANCKALKGDFLFTKNSNNSSYWDQMFTSTGVYIIKDKSSYYPIGGSGLFGATGIKSPDAALVAKLNESPIAMLTLTGDTGTKDVDINKIFNFKSITNTVGRKTITLKLGNLTGTAVVNVIDKTEGDFAYTVIGSKVRLDRYIGPSDVTSIVIPDSIEGKLVTDIGDGCFEKLPNLVSINANNIESIGQYAFADTGVDKSLVLNLFSVSNISNNAFQNFKGTINIGTQAVTFGTGVFTGMNATTGIVNVFSNLCTAYNYCSTNAAPYQLGTQKLITSLTPVSSNVNVQVGQTINIAPTIMPPTASDKRVVYTPIDGSLVSVKSNGALTGVKEGTTQVYMESADGGGGNATITVVVGPAAPTVSTISMKDTPKTIYTVGDSLDISGGTIEVTMSDSSTSTVNITSGMVSGFNSSSEGTKTVTVTYQGKTCTYEITVNPAAPVLQSIEILNPPKTAYNVGEALDIVGGTIQLNMSNGTTSSAIMTEDMLGYVNMATAGTKNITVTHLGKTCTLTITVSDITVTSISMSRLPKTNYVVNDGLDITNGQIKVNLSNGTNQTLSLTEEMVTGFDSSVAGGFDLTVTYQSKTTLYHITVAEATATVQSIKMLTIPKNTYSVGEALSIVGGSIEITMSDNTTSSAVLTSGMVSGFNSSVVGDGTVTVTYEGKTCTYPVTVLAEAPKVVSIAVVEGTFTKTTYNKGEALDVIGAQILVNYSDGSNKTISLTDTMITGYNRNVIGDQALTVTYEGKTCQVNVLVKEAETAVTITADYVDVPCRFVTVKVTVTGDIKEIILPNNSKMYKSTFDYTIRANGTYVFSVLGKDGVSTDSTIVELTQIDNVAPVISLGYKIDDLSNISVNILEDGTGLKESTNPDGTTTSALSYTYDGSSVIGTFRAEDMAGNVGTKELTVNPVTISGQSSTTFVGLEGIPTEWINSAVTLKVGAVNATDGLVGIEEVAGAVAKLSVPTFKMPMRSMLMGSLASDVTLFGAGPTTTDPIVKDFTVSDNGTKSYDIIASTGSYTKSVTIDKIDMVAPNITATANGKTVTVNVSDNLSGIKEVTLPDGTTDTINSDGSLSKTYSMDLLGNGTFNMSVRDYAGNITNNTVAVNYNPDTPVVVPPVDNGGSTGGGGGSTVTPVEPPKVETPVISFQDWVSVNKEVLKNGYVKGYEDSTFRAKSALTRAEFAAMLDRIVTLNNNSNSATFKDVDKSWAKSSIINLANAGVINGYEDGTFKPNNKISREEISAILDRILVLNTNSKDTKFMDISRSFAKKNIIKLNNAGIIKGVSEYEFKPLDTTTRAEAVTLVNRIFLDSSYKEKANEFKDIKSSDWFYSDVLKAISK